MIDNLEPAVDPTGSRVSASGDQNVECREEHRHDGNVLMMMMNVVKQTPAFEDVIQAFIVPVLPGSV